MAKSEDWQKSSAISARRYWWLGHSRNSRVRGLVSLCSALHGPAWRTPMQRMIRPCVFGHGGQGCEVQVSRGALYTLCPDSDGGQLWNLPGMGWGEDGSSQWPDLSLYTLFHSLFVKTSLKRLTQDLWKGPRTLAPPRSARLNTFLRPWGGPCG